MRLRDDNWRESAKSTSTEQAGLRVHLRLQKFAQDSSAISRSGDAGL